MRSSMSGCVAMSAEDFFVKVCTGLTMNRCCVARLTPGKGAALAASFRNAEISPSGLRVNWTDVASARYSRWRDTAICTHLAATGASSAEARASALAHWKEAERAAKEGRLVVLASSHGGAILGAAQLVVHQRQLQPERRRLRMDAMATPDARRHPMLPRPSPRNRRLMRSPLR